MACQFGEKLKQNNKMKNSLLVNKKEISGFTLIEMIVSIGIIMVISLIFIANYNTSSKRTDLIMTAQSIVADIHAAQNHALGLVKYDGEVPVSGWGVNFDKVNNTYTIFADTDPMGSYGYQLYFPYKGDPALGARKVIISDNLEIEEIKIYPNNSAMKYSNNLNIIFLPPDPKTSIIDQNDRTSANLVYIKLKEKGTNSSRTISVNILGLAEIID